jgi:nitric oxide reductase activation protein
LIVLSDGAPADSEATRKAIADARKKGITVFGIYFEEGAIGSQANTFKKMYEKDYVCVPADQIDDTLTKLMIKFSRS